LQRLEGIVDLALAFRRGHGGLALALAAALSIADSAGNTVSYSTVLLSVLTIEIRKSWRCCFSLSLEYYIASIIASSSSSSRSNRRSSHSWSSLAAFKPYPLTPNPSSRTRFLDIFAKGKPCAQLSSTAQDVRECRIV
jgi:hypothetical protein